MILTLKISPSPNDDAAASRHMWMIHPVIFNMVAYMIAMGMLMMLMMRMMITVIHGTVIHLRKS